MDANDARQLLRESGFILIEHGVSGGFQLIFLASELSRDRVAQESPLAQAKVFQDEFRQRFSVQPSQQTKDQQFSEMSFHPSQLLRVYQAMLGKSHFFGDDLEMRAGIREQLDVNGEMPVGSTRVNTATYVTLFESLTTDERLGRQRDWVRRTLDSLAQRREELLDAARRDEYHWNAVLRPAELIDFDLVALFLAGFMRPAPRDFISSAFVKHDAWTALPYRAAQTLASIG